MLAPWMKSFDKPRQHIKTQRYYFTDKGLLSQNYSFASSGVWLWELDHKKVEHQRVDAFECGVGGDPWESLRLQQDPTNQS